MAVLVPLLCRILDCNRILPYRYTGSLKIKSSAIFLPGNSLKEKIPTEIELSELYNISRITVRNAVKELVAEGYLVKKAGEGDFCLSA